MTDKMTEETKAEIRDALIEAMKARDAEVGVLLKKTEDDVKSYGKIQEGTKEAIADLNKKGQEMQARLLELEQKSVAEKGPGLKEKSLGLAFAESDEMKDYKERGGKGHSRKYECKTITSVSGSGAAGIWSDRLPSVVEDPLRFLSVRDLLDQGTTSSNLIEWIRENVFTNNADVVSEGTLKPESNITYERVDVPVRTIAHWVMASRQVLADYKQLATLINGRLRYGLKIKEEDQILLGDGTGENILGLIPQATAYSTSRNKIGDTRLDVIRHAMLQVRKSYYPASGIVLSPEDWEGIELTKDSQNRYLMAAPTQRAPAMLWGLPVSESDAMPVGEFLVGSFRMAATLFDREEAGIYISTEDRDNFIKNMVTILCEERLALAVSRPKAFVHGGFPASSSS